MLEVVDSLPTLGKHFKADGNIAVITHNSITGYELNLLAGASLSVRSRLLLSIGLIGGFSVIGAVSWYHSRQRKQTDENQPDSDEPESL
jgi:hypothetical protein